jgi:hypothetical protein
MGTVDDKAMREAVIAKLHPGQIRLSERMSAILGYLLDEDFPGHKITSMAPFGEDKVLVVGLDGEFVALESEMAGNLRGVSGVAGLSPEETRWLVARLPARTP